MVYDYLIVCGFGELIGLEVRRLPDAAKNYLSPTVRLLIHSPAFPLLHSHVLSSRLRLRQGPPSRRLPRPRPYLLRRRRLHILSLLYCHNSSKVQLHRRQVAAVYQCHLVVCVVHFAGICATHHCRVPGRKVDIGLLSLPVIPVPVLRRSHSRTLSLAVLRRRRTNSSISPSKRRYRSR